MKTGKASRIRNEMINVVQQNIGMRIMRHARGAHVDDRDDEVERSGHRGDAEDLQADDPEIDVRPGLGL